MGYVDLHLHLLPGVDDGCRELSDSVELARALVALGFTKAAPSPHHRPEYAPPEAQRAQLEPTRRALTGAGLALELFHNAESYFLDERLLPSLGTPDARTLNDGGKVLLVEAPYTSPLPMLGDLIFRMKLKGVTPLIAHPERCYAFEKKGAAAEAVRAGALLQLDVGALIGRYGKPAQKLARSFLGDGLYAVAATDCHSPTKVEAWVGECLQALEKAVGAAGVQRLFAETPEALLRGEVPS